MLSSTFIITEQLMPKPGESESREDFVSRCIPIVLEEGNAEDQDQAVAMCNSIWKRESKAMAEPHEILLNHVRSRSSKRTEFNYGILTADRYVKTMEGLIGAKSFRHICEAGGEDVYFEDVLQKAANTLTYSHPDMEVKAKQRQIELPIGVEVPKNTLMVFRHILTTSKKDRDGDILRTGGAVVDPKMLMLWQHVHTLPIGKMLAPASHTKDELQLISCIVDMNEVCHDSAVMIDNEMGRFSHGFRALDFMEIKAGREGDEDVPGGYDVKRFEILEESLVSVPANPDAETQEVIVSLVEGGKLTSGLMKECAQGMRKQMPLSIPVEVDLKVMVNGQEVKDANKSRDEEERDESGASKETGIVPDEGKEKEGTKDKEVEDLDKKNMWAGDLQGSWEWTEQKLRGKVKKFLMVSDVPIGENDWATVIGTYSDHAIICLDRMGEFEYYRASWSNVNGEPNFTGVLKKVHIETTTQITEKMKVWKKALADDSESGGSESVPLKTEDEKGDLICPKCDYKGSGKDGNCPECGAKLVVGVSDKDKSFDVEKAGRVLSKANEGKIKEAIDDVSEVVSMDVSRPAKALLNQAKRGLDEVVTSLGDEGVAKETSEKIGVKKAMAIVLTEGSKADLDTLRSLLGAFEKREEAESVAEQFSEFVGQ